jgi:hypothetical protein
VKGIWFRAQSISPLWIVALWMTQVVPFDRFSNSKRWWSLTRTLWQFVLYAACRSVFPLRSASETYRDQRLQVLVSQKVDGSSGWRLTKLDEDKSNLRWWEIAGNLKDR